jgi:hypothetical protein
MIAIKKICARCGAMCCTFDKNNVAIVAFLHDIRHFEKKYFQFSTFSMHTGNLESFSKPIKQFQNDEDEYIWTSPNSRTIDLSKINGKNI